MKVNILRYLSYFFFVISLIFLSTKIYFINYCSKNITNISESINLNDVKGEKFSDNLIHINNLDMFKDIIEEEISKKKHTKIEIAFVIDKYIRNKFIHGKTPGKIKLCENWFLYVILPYFPNDLKFAVNPKDIIKNSNAFCNQQSIIFQNILNDYKIEYGSVRFFTPPKGHFAVAAKIKDEWYFFDSNEEANYNIDNPAKLDDVMNGKNNIFKKLYGDKWFVDTLESGAKNSLIKLTDINSFPAKKALFFQNFTKFISNWFWIFTMTLGFILFKFNKKII